MLSWTNSRKKLFEQTLCERETPLSETGESFTHTQFQMSGTF